MLQTLYIHVLASFNIILIGLATNGSTFCDQVHCENNSPCQTVFSHGKGDSHVSARCVCHGKWAGTRCESQIHVIPGVITSSSAEIGIHVQNPVTENTTGSSSHTSFSYTLMYWNNNTDYACSLIQELTSQTHRVDGLEPSTDYIICVESGIVETCSITFHNQTTLSTNCVFITSPEIPSRTFSNYIAGVVTCVFIVVVVLAIIVTAILIRRRHYILFDNLFGFCRCSNCKCCRRKRPRVPTAATDMIVSPDSPLMESSCKTDFSGKAKHRLKLRPRGYASYSTKNDKMIVLSTVLEYNPEGDLLESDPLACIT